MDNFASFLEMISTEFQKYVMENEAFADKIPAKAMVIFQIEGDSDFNRWHQEVSLRNREADQPIIYVYVKKWREHSSIEEVNLSEVAA